MPNQRLTDAHLAEMEQAYQDAIRPRHPQFDCDLIARANRRAVETLPALIAEVRRLRGLVKIAVQYMPEESEVTKRDYAENTDLVRSEIATVRRYLKEHSE